MRNRRRWTGVEIDILRREYPKRSTKDVAIFVGHSEGSVRVKAHQLGLKKECQGTRWRPWMLDILKENYPVTNTSLLCEWLGLTAQTVRRKARELGIRKTGWRRRTYRETEDGKRRIIDPEDDSYIREHVGTDTLKDIAERIGVSTCALSHYCKVHGISRFYRKSSIGFIELTPFGEAYLKRHYANMKNAELVAKIGISQRSVIRKARQLGLTKSTSFMKRCQRETAKAAREANLKREKPPKGFRIPGGESYQFKKGVTSLQRLGRKREAERIRNSAASRAKTRILELERVSAGLPQLTKMKVTRQPKRKIQLRCYLKSRGYVVARNSDIVYYNGNTRRSGIEKAAGEFFKFEKQHADTDIDTQCQTRMG